LLKAVGDMQGQRADLNGARVLLLSNDHQMRLRMQQVAPNWGTQLTNSESTQDALARLRAALTRGPTWAFDLLMVDLNSVRSTAIALHRNLQRSAEFEGLPVVWLKGQEAPPPELNDGQQVLILSRAMGSAEMRTAIATFIATPAAAARLAPRAVPELFAADVTESPEGPIGGPLAAATLKGAVLLVEDNPINQKVAQSLIKILGLECETVENGELAIARMARGELDLVLMDCQMPVKDGYTATREWRLLESERGLAPLPIIAMTANAMAGDRMKCLDAGMDDYLSKPVDRRLLESCLALWLQRSPRREGGGRRKPTTQVPVPESAARAAEAVVPMTPSATTTAERVAISLAVAETTPPPRPMPAAIAPAIAPAASAPAPAPASTPAAPVLEMEVVEELRAIMGAEYQGLVKLFFEDAPLHIQRLQAALAANDLAAMVVPAHTLKSSSANLGAQALSAVAKRIELGARTASLDKPAVAVMMLENEFRRAKAALESLVDA
jgi:CheY-like chemotaxis protein